MIMPQIEPVTSLSRDYRTIFGKLSSGPVFLAQRSRPAAVLLSIHDYEQIIKRVQQLEGLLQAKEALAQLDRGEIETTSHDELMRLILEKRAHHVGA